MDEPRPSRAGRRKCGHFVAASGEELADHGDEGVAISTNARSVFLACALVCRQRGGQGWVVSEGEEGAKPKARSATTRRTVTQY